MRRGLHRWAYLDLNQGPHPYQGCALTRLSYRPVWTAMVPTRVPKALGGATAPRRRESPYRATMVVVGTDVWKRGWVAVTLRDGTVESVACHGTLADVVAAARTADVIGVDIPIGLPDPPPRAADAAARRFVGPRGSSVFDALPAPLTAATTYREALAECRARYGRGISAQAFALRRRILEAAVLAEGDARLREVHPEVSFTAMAGAVVTHAKRTWNGQMLRRRLLEHEGIEIPATLEAEAGEVPVDDVLDAAAAAWSARRIADGAAGTLPEDPEPGDPVIWY